MNGATEVTTLKPAQATGAPEWPGLPSEALHGLAGEVVRLIDPHTEADNAAILFQFLIIAGVSVGRGPYYQVESDQHHANLDGLIVASSAKGRKGTSLGRALRVAEIADPTLAGRTESGLSSGEGFIWAVRDPASKEDNTAPTDKRLLVIESEFASALKVLGREGNTLSAVMRNAWDGRVLQSLTKNNPAKATGAHIGVIGHITQTELKRHLSATESANGFGNRFLYVCAKRSKVLPFGGNLDDEALQALGLEVRGALETARTFERVTMDVEARDVWRSVYPELSEGQPGLLGSLIARSEAQVLRLALIYALLDASRVIKRVHLEAGLACWDYCEASARYLFGDSLGDPTADSILAALRKHNGQGMTRTQISAHLGRHITSGEIDRALSDIAAAKRASPSQKDTGGRPSEVWHAH